LALRWSEIDLEAGRLSVVANSVRLTKRSRELLGIGTPEPLRGEPKTKRGRRVVELPQLAVDALREHRRKAKVVELNGRVFSRPDGRAIAVPSLCSQWHALLRRAGVRTVRPHDARHTAATLMLEQGVHPKLVSEMLGHATVAIALDLYSQATPSMHRAAARSLNAAFGGPLGGQIGGQLPSQLSNPNTKSECRGRDSNPYKVALTSPSS
jgi:integrase